MDFYIFPVLFPGLLIDALLSVWIIGFWRKGRSMGEGHAMRKDRSMRKGNRMLSAFLPALSYLLTAFICIVFYSGDPRFQGQGVLGLMLFKAIGIAFTLIRLLLGSMLFVSLKCRK